MANWEKLNKEFYSLMDNFTDEDWDNWMRTRSEKRKECRARMAKQAKIQAEKIKNI